MDRELAYKAQTGEEFLLVSQDLVKEVGLLEAYIFSYLAYKQAIFGKNFYQSMSQIAEVANCHSSTARNAIMKLEEHGYISKNLLGMPATFHYTCNEEMLDSSFRKNRKLVLGKTANKFTENPKTNINNNISNDKSVFSSTKIHKGSGPGCSCFADVPVGLFGLATIEKKEGIKKQPNNRIKRIDSPFYKLIEWIITARENKDLPFSRHRMPNKQNPTPTKLVTQCVQYLEQYARAEFGKDKIIDSSFTHNLQFSMTFHEVENDVKRAIMNFRKALNESYLPQNKEHLKEMSLDVWFYNGRNNRSWFLECVHNNVKLKSEVLAKDIKEKLPSCIDEIFGQFYLSDKSPKEELEYWQNLKSIYDKWQWLTSDKRYGDWYNDSQWVSYFKSLSQFCQTYFNYIKDFQHPLHILSTASDTWRRFENYVWDTYKIELSPSDKTIEKLKAKQQEDEKQHEKEKYERVFAKIVNNWKERANEFLQGQTATQEDKDDYLLGGFLAECVAIGITDKMYQYAKSLVPQAYDESGQFKERFKRYEKSLFMASFTKE